MAGQPDLFIPRKTEPTAHHGYAQDMRDIEMWAKGLTGSNVTVGQIGVGNFPGNVAGTTFLNLNGESGSRTWLITDAEGDTNMRFGNGWVSIVGAAGLLSSAVFIGGVTFSGVASLTILTLNIGAVSPAGTNAHVWTYTGPTALTSGGSITPTGAQFSTLGTVVGTDLTLDSSGRIVTTAGGIYLVSVFVAVDYTGAIFNV